MFFKKDKVVHKIFGYPLNKDVSFELAFKALKDEYLIKHPNYQDVYFLMLNNKIFSIQDRSDGSSKEIKEFDTFSMLMNKWKILKNIK